MADTALVIMTAAASSDDIHKTLEFAPGRRGRLRAWIVGVLVLVVAAAGLLQLLAANRDTGPRFKTEPVGRGVLTVTITATGELTPVTQVTIGTEISGIIESVAVDFNSRVRKGQVLAKVNSEKSGRSGGASKSRTAGG